MSLRLLIQRNLQWPFVAALSGGVVMSILPHTMMLNQYREFYQLFIGGAETPLDPETKKLTKQVCKDILVPEPVCEFFACYGFEPVHMGSFNLAKGCIVGLPLNFKYKTIHDVDTDKIFVMQKDMDHDKPKPPKWNSDAGVSLLDSLVLSENAKKFAIARELEYCNSHYVWVNSGLICAYGFLAYWMGFATNVLLNLRKRLKPWARGGLYTGFAAASYSLYIVSHDAYSFRKDKKVDRKVGGISVQYAIGGLEFYTKALQRNQAVRTLMGEEGAKLFSPSGNRNLFIRAPHVPLTKRRDAMMELCMDKSQPVSVTPVDL